MSPKNLVPVLGVPSSFKKIFIEEVRHNTRYYIPLGWEIDVN